MLQLPFIPNHLYNRRKEIHGVFGGNWQSGICPSSSHPYIFIFTGKTGQQHGYEDQWDNDHVFSYTGEGQSGDMSFVRGNLALKNHIQDGKRVFLFENEGKGFARFICEVECFDIDFFETNDTAGHTRIGIKFFFKQPGQIIPTEKAKELTSLVSEPAAVYANFKPNETERKGLVTSRVGQGAYRKRIIHRWNYQCAVTGFNKLEVLIASHILPWAESNNNERLDVHNGLLLSPAYDALFDKHLISFDNQGKIILSDKVEIKALERIGITGQEKIKGLSDGNLEYLEKHQKFILQ